MAAARQGRAGQVNAGNSGWLSTLREPQWIDGKLQAAPAAPRSAAGSSSSSLVDVLKQSNWPCHGGVCQQQAHAAAGSTVVHQQVVGRQVFGSSAAHQAWCASYAAHPAASPARLQDRFGQGNWWVPQGGDSLRAGGRPTSTCGGTSCNQPVSGNPNPQLPAQPACTSSAPAHLTCCAG